MWCSGWDEYCSSIRSRVWDLVVLLFLDKLSLLLRGRSHRWLTFFAQKEKEARVLCNNASMCHWQWPVPCWCRWIRPRTGRVTVFERSHKFSDHKHVFCNFVHQSDCHVQVLRPLMYLPLRYLTISPYVASMMWVRQIFALVDCDLCQFQVAHWTMVLQRILCQ